MKRAKRRWWLVAVIAILAAVAATAGVFLARTGKTPGTRYLTATAGTGSIARTVEADFTLSNARASTTISLGGTSAAASSSATTSSATMSSTGVVTGLALAAGQTPRTLERLLTVSGKPIYAFVSTAPLYETLSTSLTTGNDATNVAALQRALKSAGYFSGTVNGDFGATTKTALEAWQAAKGLSQTGTITTARFVWVRSGGELSSWSVGLGSAVSAGTSLATIVFPRPLAATASVSQADIPVLRVGQKAELTVSSTSSVSFVGTIAAIDTQPASTSSTSSTTTVAYDVTFRLASVPAAVKSGMSGTLVVTIAKRSNVLIVPTSALTGASYVRVMTHGKPVYRRVSTGMATSAYTQITSGLTAGDVVMTGTYSSAATTTTPGSTSSSSRSLLNSLTGGSGPSGGGAPPGAGL
jgi:peptidoglycan hydrolase-like protein with peptidoglycan-binding domain